MLLTLRTIDPAKCQTAVEGLWAVWMSVLTTLKFKFAKTIALGNSIGNMLMKPANTFFVPILYGLIVNPAYHKWIGPIIRYTVKSIAISVAWYVQQVLSTVQSAIKGGLIFSRHMLKFLNEKGFIT